MKASIELPLFTREVYKLFERKIDGDRLFIGAILHKFNHMMRRSRQEATSENNSFKKMERDILRLTEQFSNEINRIEGLLQKKKDFNDRKIHFIAQFHQSITVNNPLCMYLIEFIAVYDKLLATIKLLQLARCFVSEQDYFSYIKRNQREANQLLSKLLLEKRQ